MWLCGFQPLCGWVSLPLQPRVSVSRPPGLAALLARLCPAGKEPQCQPRAPAGAQAAQPCPGPEELGEGSKLGLARADTALRGSAVPAPVPSRPFLVQGLSHSRNRRCRPSKESRESGPGVHPALVSCQDGWAAPGRARGGFGELGRGAGVPGGAQGCGVDQH